MIYKRKGVYHLDATVVGVRYRESLHTPNWKLAKDLEKTRVSEIQAGKGSSKTGRDFARKPFHDAAEQFIEERKPHVSERTHQLDRERLKPLIRHFGDTPLLRIKADDIAAYQRARLSGALRLSKQTDGEPTRGVSPRTCNMEITVLRLMMRRGKVWNVVAEDVNGHFSQGD